MDGGQLAACPPVTSPCDTDHSLPATSHLDYLPGSNGADKP